MKEIVKICKEKTIEFQKQKERLEKTDKRYEKCIKKT